MRRTFSIAFLQFKLEFSKKATILTMIGLPLIFTLIFGGMFGQGGGNSVPVAIVDHDRSVASREVVKELQSEQGLNAVIIPGSELKAKFIDKRIAAGVVIPKGFQNDILKGSEPSVDLTVLPGNSNADAMVKPSLNRALARISKGLRTAKAMKGGSLGSNYAEFKAELGKSGVVVAAEEVRKPEKNAESSLGEVSLGFTIMFMMFLVFQMCGVILRERDHGTWGRLLTTPIRRHEVIIGYLCSFVISALAQFAIMVTASSLLFGVKWGPILPLFTVALAFALAACGMGLFLAGVVKTPEQQGAISNIFVTVTSMLGGAFWSLDYVSPMMRKVAYFTPQAWAMEGFKEILLRGGGLGDIFLPVAVLVGFAVIFLSAGIVRVKY